MQIEHDELLDAVNAVLGQQHNAMEPAGITTQELCEACGYSREHARKLIDAAIKNGKLKSVRVWRETNAGYRTRVPGWLPS